MEGRPRERAHQWDWRGGQMDKQTTGEDGLCLLGSGQVEDGERHGKHLVQDPNSTLAEVLV